MGSYFEPSLRIWMEEGVMDKGSVRGGTGHPPLGKRQGSVTVQMLSLLSSGSVMALCDLVLLLLYIVTV